LLCELHPANKNKYTRMNKIAIIYGPLGGNTEKVTKQVADSFSDSNVTIVPVQDGAQVDFGAFDCIIFGGPTLGTHTWRDAPKENHWDLFMAQLPQLQIKGAVCAIFGLGDHVSYAHHFVDDIGVLAEKLEAAGAKLIGFTPVDEYIFEHSKAQRGDYFLGLPIDEDFEANKSSQRITNWVSQLSKEFNAQS